MPPTNIGTNEVTSGSPTTLSTPITAAVPAGDTVFASLAVKFSVKPTAFGCTDDAGNTYTVDVSYDTDGGMIVSSVLDTGLAIGDDVTFSFTGGTVSAAFMSVETDAGALLRDGPEPSKTTISSNKTHTLAVTETGGDLYLGYDFATSNETTATTASPFTQLGLVPTSTGAICTGYHLPVGSGTVNWSNTWSTSHSGFMLAVPYTASGISGTATFGATGTLGATGTPELPGVATFGATGTLTATGEPETLGTAAFTATGTLTAAGTPQLLGTLAYTATGTLIATSPTTTVRFAATAGGWVPLDKDQATAAGFTALATKFATAGGWA